MAHLCMYYCWPLPPTQCGWGGQPQQRDRMKASSEAFWYSPFNLIPQSISSELFIQISTEIMAMQGLHTDVGIQTASAKWRFARVRDWSTLLSFFPTVTIATLDQLFRGISDEGVLNALAGLVAPALASPIHTKLSRTR